jgi:hypothetical protein
MADVQLALSTSAGVRRRYAELVLLDESTRGYAGPSTEDAALLGLEPVPKPRSGAPGFEARVVLALAPAARPVTRRPLQLGFAAAAVATCALLLVWFLPQSTPEFPGSPSAEKSAAPASDEYAPRGAPPSDSVVRMPLELSGVCLVTAPGGKPQTVPVEDSVSDGMRCPVHGSFQPVVSDPHARALSVAVFAVQRTNSGQWSAVPHAPTPASVQPVRLEATAAPQAVGRPHRLGVNHAANTAGWLVVVGRRADISYADVEDTMKLWTRGRFPAQAAGEEWETVVVRPFRVEGQ